MSKVITFDKDKRAQQDSAKAFCADVEKGAKFISATLDDNGDICFWHSDMQALTAIGLTHVLLSYFNDMARDIEC